MMQPAGLREIYTKVLADDARPSREGCATPDELLALLERSLPPQRRFALLDHVASCGACIRELQLLQAVHEDPAAAPSRILRPSTWLAAAAVALVAIGGTFAVRASHSNPSDDTLRGGTSARVVAVSPQRGQAVKLPVRLVWRAVPGASSYTTEVLSAQGTPLGSISSPDTALTLPPTVALSAGSSYAWKVTADLRDGTSIQSRLEHFTVAP